MTIYFVGSANGIGPTQPEKLVVTEFDGEKIRATTPVQKEEVYWMNDMINSTKGVFLDSKDAEQYFKSVEHFSEHNEEFVKILQDERDEEMSLQSL